MVYSLTVVGVMPSSFAMALFESPREIDSRISLCLGVRGSMGGSLARSFATLGDMYGFPDATVHMAVTSSVSAADLKTTPFAP